MRASWDDYFMQIAEVVKTRSTCMRRQVGAVIVKDNHIVTTGYNGAPSGLKHCTDVNSCERERLNIPSGERHELCRALHAEQNAIICAKMLINAGIKRIVYKGNYPDKLSKLMLEEAGIELVPVE